MQTHIRAFVLDKDRKPLMPCHAARARKLLKKGKAAVFRRFPFTIILKERTREYGFPLCYFSRRKRPNDFGTGDYVRVKVTRGRNAGIWTGRATLTNGKLSVETKVGRVKATFRNGKVLFKNDGYKYQYL